MRIAGAVFAFGALLLLAGIVTAVAVGGSWAGPGLFLAGFAISLIGGTWSAVLLAKQRLARR